jgi:hypothetical protein
VRQFILAVSSVCRRLTPWSQTGVQITLAKEKSISLKMKIMKTKDVPFLNDKRKTKFIKLTIS